MNHDGKQSRTRALLRRASARRDASSQVQPRPIARETARIAELYQAIPFAILGYSFVAALMWYAASGRIPESWRTLWVTMLLLGGIAIASPWVAQALAGQRPTRKRSWTPILALGALIWGVHILIIPFAMWSVAQETERLLIAGIVVAMMSVGATLLMTLPYVNFVWISVVTSGTVWLLSLDGNAQVRWLIFSLIAYSIAMSVVTRVIGKHYVAMRRAQGDAARQAEMLSVLLQDFEEEARDWLWEIDADGRLRHASQRMAEFLGKPIEALKGAKLLDVLTPPDGAEDTNNQQGLAELSMRLVRGNPFRNQLIEYVVHGGARWISLSAKPLYDGDDRISGWRGAGVDVTNEFVRQREMERLATLDSLTGLANRYRLMQELDHFFPPLKEPMPCALMLLDLDNFKHVNDTFGHPVGDKLLQVVAIRLRQQLRGDQLLARLGGDEFALVVPGDVPRSRLQELGERVLLAVSQPCQIDQLWLEIRASLGVAISGRDANDAHALLRSADLALYSAKGAGRNAVRFFGYELQERAQYRYTVAEEIRLGMARQEFVLFYQPFVRTSDGAVTGFEALMRWNHPTRGLIGPVEFIHVAEEMGLIGTLGEWAFRTACMAAKAWPSDVRISVNVSAIQFSFLTLGKAVEEALELSGIAAHRLEVEITESALVTDSALARSTMKALRERGVQISLDDFGAGHASLNHLRSFPITRLKIDRTFTEHLALATREGASSRSIVKAAIDLARGMELESTAEGVEREDQWEVLKRFYCDEVQGFYVAAPMQTSEVANFLATRATASQRVPRLNLVHNAAP